MTDIKSKLYKPFENVDSRRGRGGTYDYIKWQSVVDRMNEVFGVNWSSNVTKQDITDDRIIVRVNVCIKDPITGEYFCQEGYGGAVLRTEDEPGNAHKSAYSKALKDACKKWGVGLHIEEDNAGGSTVPSGYMGKETGVPPTNTPSSTPPVPNTQSNQAPPTQPSQSAAPQNVPPSMPPQQNTPPAVGSVQNAPPQQPVDAPTNTAPTENTNQGPPTTPTHGAGAGMGLPPTPPPNVDNGSNKPSTTYSQPSTGNNNQAPDQNAPGTITNVQELAIGNLINLSDRASEGPAKILKELSEDSNCELNRVVTELKDLSFREAVSVIKAMKSLQQ